MAEEKPQDERTEAPTARRLQKAREDGQVARSQELPTAAVMIFATAFLVVMGNWMLSGLIDAFASGFVFDRRLVFAPELLAAEFSRQFMRSLMLFVPMLVLTAIVAIVASGVTGGFLFSINSVAPKLSKFDLLEGFKRMFGMKALVELLKALAKFGLVAGALYLIVMSRLDELNTIGLMSLEPALRKLAELLGMSALLITLALVLIAAVDAPYQRHEFMKRMRMAKQDIRDEMKDMEGRPEVKAAIRRRQREMASARMMQRVKDADVVVTNPTHFAVALSYDPDRDDAPVVIAKGADLIAQRIREEAQSNGVQLFEAPELARALYFTTKLDGFIPEVLYKAVAEVVSYVFSLAAAGDSSRVRRPDPVVPESMRFDEEGRRDDETNESENR